KKGGVSVPQSLIFRLWTGTKLPSACTVPLAIPTFIPTGSVQNPSTEWNKKQEKRSAKTSLFSCFLCIHASNTFSLSSVSVLCMHVLFTLLLRIGQICLNTVDRFLLVSSVGDHRNIFSIVQTEGHHSHNTFRIDF